MSPSEPGNYSEEALAIAQRVVYELSGRRVVWPAITTTETLKIGRSPVIRLSGSPIIGVESAHLVTQYGETISPVEFTKINSSRIRLHLGASVSASYGVSNSDFTCHSANRYVEITYSYGAVPPQDLVAGTIELAEQYTLLLNDESPTVGGCSLPPNARSVSSRGISVELEDTDEILSQGKTGIDSLDNAIARYNKLQVASRSRLVSPTFPPSVRSNTHTRA